MRTLIVFFFFLLSVVSAVAGPNKMQFYIRKAYAGHLGNQIFMGDRQLTFIKPIMSDAGFVKVMPSSNRQFYLAEFREFSDNPDSGTIGLLEVKTGHFKFVAGYKVANATKDSLCRGATDARWLDNNRFKMKIISYPWRQPLPRDFRTSWKTLTVATKSYCPPEQKVAETIGYLIRSDKQMKGMRLLDCQYLSSNWKNPEIKSEEDEIQAYVGHPGKFPQWWLRYRMNGKFISKELIYGE